jgi:hypothetical protein
MIGFRIAGLLFGVRVEGGQGSGTKCDFTLHVCTERFFNSEFTTLTPKPNAAILD